jgi:hypothetical protein
VLSAMSREGFCQHSHQTRFRAQFIMPSLASKMESSSLTWLSLVMANAAACDGNPQGQLGRSQSQPQTPPVSASATGASQRVQPGQIASLANDKAGLERACLLLQLREFGYIPGRWLALPLWPLKRAGTSCDEEDHLMPLVLGSPPYDPHNLWPEPRGISSATAGSTAAKDKLEVTLACMVGCRW